MRVSIIIPTYNRAHLICHSIDSILAQTYRDYEIIVIDDGSTDNTGEALKRYGSRIKYVRQENRGFGAARNRGLEEVTGEYIAFLDSDDLWKDYKLALQVELMERLPQAVFLFTDFTILKPSGDMFPKGLSTWHESKLAWDEIYGQKVSSSSLGLTRSAEKDFDLYLGNIYGPLLEEPLVLPSSAIVRRSSLRPEILFTVGDPLYADWDFFARLAKDGTACYVDFETTINRSHKDDVRLTTNCGKMRTIECRLSLLNRVWKADRQFMSNHGEIFRQVEDKNLFLLAVQLLSNGQRVKAGETLSRLSDPHRTFNYRFLRLLTAIPGSPHALLAVRAIKRFF